MPTKCCRFDSSGSASRWCHKNYSSSRRPERLCGSCSLQFGGYQSPFLGVKRSESEVDLSLPIAPRLRMSGSISLLPFVISRRGQGQLRFFFYFLKLIVQLNNTSTFISYFAENTLILHYKTREINLFLLWNSQETLRHSHYYYSIQ